MQCWATNLGGCSSTQSGEHTVSKCLFTGPTVDVRGFHWCPEEFKTVGINSLTANILCTNHNSQLSPLDSAAQSAWEMIEEAVEMQSRRDRGRGKQYPVKHRSLQSRPLQRWFLKTAINVLIQNKHDGTWDSNGREAIDVPPPLLEHIFLDRDLPEPLGIYLVARQGTGSTDEAHVGIRTLLSGQREFAAVVMQFRSLTFLSWLHSSPPGPRLPNQDALDPSWRNAHLFLRNFEVRFDHRRSDVRPRLSQSLRFTY